MGDLAGQQKGARAHGWSSSRAVRRTRCGRLPPGAVTELRTAGCRLPGAPTHVEPAGDAHFVGVSSQSRLEISFTLSRSPSLVKSQALEPQEASQ